RRRPPRRSTPPALFFRAEAGIRRRNVTGVQTCALPIYPTTCCVTITHLFASRQQPTASPTASHHRGAASPTRKPRLTVTRDDQVSGHHLNPHPRTLNKPTPAPQKSSTSRQPRRPRQLPATHPTRRRPGTPPTPSNTLEPARTRTQPDPSTPTTATRRPRSGNAPSTTHHAPTLWRSTLRRSRTGNARARGADRPRGHPHLGQQLHPRHRTLLWNTPSTPTTASTTTQSSASRRAHIIEHTKSQPHRQRQRPRTGQYNDPILGQRINHAIEHGKSPLHRHHERPATTLTTTQSSAN